MFFYKKSPIVRLYFAKIPSKDKKWSLARNNYMMDSGISDFLCIFADINKKGQQKVKVTA